MPQARARWLVILIALVPLAGCASSGSPQAEAAAVPSEARVDLKDMKFAPTSVTLAVGGTITWTNRDDMGHTITPADKTQWGSEGSGDDPETWLQNGDSWGFTFSKPGTYHYYCVPHASRGSTGDYRGMVGAVVVKEADA